MEFYRRRPLESSVTTQRNSRANSSNFTCKHCLQCCNLRHSNNIVMGDWKGGRSFTIKKKTNGQRSGLKGSEVLYYQHVQLRTFDPAHLPGTCWVCFQCGYGELQKQLLPLPLTHHALCFATSNYRDTIFISARWVAVVLTWLLLHKPVELQKNHVPTVCKVRCRWGEELLPNLVYPERDESVYCITFQGLARCTADRVRNSHKPCVLVLVNELLWSNLDY